MTVLQAVLLGLVQGFAEFLPISSSGHLVLARALFDGMPPPSLAFDVALHLGTTAAVVVVFGKDLLPPIRALPILLAPASWRAKFETDRGFRLLALLIVSAIPAGVVGLSFRHQIAALEDHRPDVVALLLVVTGVWLWVASAAQRRAEARPPAADGERPLGLREAIWIGVAQAVAVLPGISRSGATLGAGLLLRIRRDVVGPFAFLMSIAPVLGAAALEVPKLADEESIKAGPLVCGILVAFVSGVAALKLLLPFVRRGRLGLFAVYCVVVGPLAYWRIRHGG